LIDIPVVVETLRLVVERMGLELVKSGNSVLDCLDVVKQSAPELLILDPLLPSGLDLLKSLRFSYPELKILVFAFNEELYGLRCLSAGVNGFLEKNASVTKITVAIEEVILTGLSFSEALGKKVVRLTVLAKPGHFPSTEPLDALSDRELQIFTLIGRGIRTRQIAEDLGLNVKTVESHKAHIKEKLCIPNCTELARRAFMWSGS